MGAIIKFFIHCSIQMTMIMPIICMGIQNNNCIEGAYLNNSNQIFKCSCIVEEWEMELNKREGYSYFKQLDISIYKQKPLSELINDISSKYELFDFVTYNGYEVFSPEQKLKRISFMAYFKVDSLNILVLKGCISHDNLIETDDDNKAYEHFQKQGIYCVTFLNLDVVRFYRFVQDDLEFYNSIEAPIWRLVQKYFVNTIKDIKD